MALNRNSVRPTMAFAVGRPEYYQLVGRVPLDLRVAISPQTGTKHHPHKFRPRQFRDIPYSPMLFIQSNERLDLFGNDRDDRFGHLLARKELRLWHMHRSDPTPRYRTGCDTRKYTAVRAARSQQD